MLAPGLAELFELLSVVSATAHPINILWNEWMIVARQSDPIDVHRPLIACVSSQRETNEAVDLTIFVLNEVKQLAYDDIGARNGPNCRHNSRFHLPVNDLVDFDRLHRSADRNFSND